MSPLWLQASTLEVLKIVRPRTRTWALGHSSRKQLRARRFDAMIDACQPTHSVRTWKVGAVSPLTAKADADHSIVLRDRLLRAVQESRELLQSNLALQADLWESHSAFEEALWQLRETITMVRQGGRHQTAHGGHA